MEVKDHLLPGKDIDIVSNGALGIIITITANIISPR